MLFSYALLYYSFAFLTFGFLKKKNSENQPGTIRNIYMKKVFLIWAVLLLVYIPWWMYHYPGIVSADSGNQIKDALTTDTLSDWNPAFVTLLIRAVILPVIHLGGSINAAVGVCTFLQMLVLTFVFALAFERTCCYLRDKTLLCLIFLFFAV